MKKCEHCKKPIERDGTCFNYWRHVDTGLYQCGKGATGRGHYAEPEKSSRRP